MEAPSSHFLDYMGFDDTGPYQSPDQDAGDGAICLHPLYNPYSSKQDVGGPLTPADPGDLVPRADVWDAFTDQLEPMAMADEKQLFVDPGFYSPGSDNEDIKAQVRATPMRIPRRYARRSSSTKSPSHRTSKSGSTSTAITPPEHEPARKRKLRKIKKESNSVEEERRRNKFLERNRIAASKCREKKKLYVSDLEDSKIGLERLHGELQSEVNDLTAEISALKHRLMGHAKCNDPNIDRWLNNEARRFVQTNNDLFGQPFLPFGQGPQIEVPPLSPRSRNPSIASSYPSLQGVPFDGLGSGERQGSIAYSHGQPATNTPSFIIIGSGSLYPSPTDDSFPLKREPDMNYNSIPDPMFSPDQSVFGGGS
ncbi:hypothetical protein C8A00DRAFT_17279 [Chaetomidium leptoderma]|uniref:BZIP domain-containing protein n=1 Tax=Chaetomidium leptoderma TaxID=669021 RepID=A0AAN6VI78_9PEZI|nr:hypothetical protein C8A00DRAFT_17279 [Chaetomidium leptoderma]